MSDIGFYRYKLGTTVSGMTYVVFKVNGATAKICQILPLVGCAGQIILKYLNRDGQYRFYAFMKEYEETDTPKEIGKVNNIIVSILSAQASAKSVGYKSDRVIKAISDPIPTDYLEILRDIYTSPRVYMRVENSGVEANDWIIVSVKASKSIRKESKLKFTTMELDITLPETYSITML